MLLMLQDVLWFLLPHQNVCPAGTLWRGRSWRRAASAGEASHLQVCSVDSGVEAGRDAPAEGAGAAAAAAVSSAAAVQVAVLA